MPMKRHLYPKDWPAISKRIRAREGNACKQCGVTNGTQAISVRGKPYKIVLTVAHLNHDPADCRDENLAALCQPCHLRLDARQHADNAYETRQRKLHEEFQAKLAAWEGARQQRIEAELRLICDALEAAAKGMRCSCCKTPVPLDLRDASWRWGGSSWEHKCPDIPAQCGHFPVEPIDDSGQE